MSRSPTSPEKLEARQSSTSALACYHLMMASGQFKLVSSTTPMMSRMFSPQPSDCAPPAAPISSSSSPQPCTPAAPGSQVNGDQLPRMLPTAPTCTPSPSANGSTMPFLTSARLTAYASTDLTRHSISNGTHGPFSGTQSFTQPTSPLTPESITRSMLILRIQHFLRHQLPEFKISQLAMLVSSIVTRIIHLGQSGDLGPYGLRHLDDIFMTIGHEGAKQYMALALLGKGQVLSLLKGTSEDLGGQEPLEDETSMEWLRHGFFNAALEEWKKLDSNMRARK